MGINGKPVFAGIVDADRLQVHVPGSEDQALVTGDRDRLRQLLLNLTDNAIKYTPEQGEIRLALQIDVIPVQAEYTFGCTNGFL